ncbi:MAG: argininosuccinate lyase [Planctomycetes bacterium]|nr:argininosuccinate lyase [Planctomycetota bacterium]
MTKTLWYKSKKGLTSGLIDGFQQSFSVDKRLTDEDIAGSIAYAQALKQAKVLSGKETMTIKKNLLKMKKQFAVRNGAKAEDVHTAVEMELTKLSGKMAGKIHTGRSRNEQVVADERLYLKKAVAGIQAEIHNLQQEIVSQAQTHIKVIMPGYTHLQQAQPILFSYYLMSWFFALERDKNRLSDCARRIDVSPYGSGALSGNSYKIDRRKLAKQLGFGGVSDNALDAISDRDFIIECLSGCAILMMHLSRVCEDLVIWSTGEFGFVRMAEGIATSSSLMPQKHNPDALELIRGKTGRVYGNLFNILTVMKGLPGGYNKDMQEDKAPMFDSVDTVQECLKILALAIKTMKIFPDRMSRAINSRILATDIADYLVKKGVPFRSSHHIVSKLVRYAIAKQQPVESLKINEFRRFSKLFDKSVYKLFDIKKSIESKNTLGGTATPMVKQQIKIARKLLEPV